MDPHASGNRSMDERPMMRLVVILSVLARIAVAQNVYVVTNDTASLDRFGRALVVNSDQPFRYRAFARQGSVPKNLADKILVWRLYDPRDGFVFLSGTPEVRDATNGEFFVWAHLDKPMGDFAHEVLWYESANTNYLGRLAWDNLTVRSPTALEVVHMLHQTNVISIGNTSVSNTLYNTISNYVDATVNIPGMTVAVDQITIPITALTSISSPSGLVATTQGDGSVAWLPRAGAVDAYSTTNYLAQVDTIRVGAGLVGSLDGGALKIEYLGGGLPPMPPGTALTNVVGYTYTGGKTGMWIQASSSATSWYVHVVGAGGGAGAIGGLGGGGGTSVAMLRVVPLAWYYLEIGEAGAPGYIIAGNTNVIANTNGPAYPSGGVGYTRGTYVGANGGGYSAIWDGAPDLTTASNLMIIAGGGSGGSTAGQRGGDGGGTSGGDGGGESAHYGRGAIGTNAVLVLPWSSCSVTGTSPGLLVGGDAQMQTNALSGLYSGSAGGGSGWGGGSGGATIGIASRNAGGGGSGWVNPEYLVVSYDRPAITIRAISGQPSLAESDLYKAHGGDFGRSGYNGVVIVAEVINL